METTKNTLIFYHAHCPDGFGAAYAAWKKFGDTAEYIPLSHGDPASLELVRGREVFFLDFCYAREVMQALLQEAKSIVVLDHHTGVEDAVLSIPGSVFDATRSGAGIAWDYFHPNTPRPMFINHIEDGDLYRFALPDTRAVMIYFEVQPMEFEVWDTEAQHMSDPALYKAFLAKAQTYYQLFERLAEISVERAKLVSFEGHAVYFTTTHSIISMRSLVGNLLAKKKGPFGLVVSAHPEGYGVSIRGDGSIDVSKIAQTYGGNGHFSSAGFQIAAGNPLPWKLIEEGEDLAS